MILETHQDKEGSYHEPATKKFVGDDVEENQRNNTPLVGQRIRDSLTATPTLAKNNKVYLKDAGQIENTTILRDKGGAAHTSRSPHVLNQVTQQRRSAGGKENIQPNSLRVNKSCRAQIGKKHISATNRMENSTIGMPRPHNFVNQSYDQNTSMGENMNTSSCSNQSIIARRLNFDQREQLKCIQGVSKGDRLTSSPSPLSRELMCSKAYIEGKKKVDKDLLSKFLYEKLFATIQQPAGCISRAN